MPSLRLRGWLVRARHRGGHQALVFGIAAICAEPWVFRVRLILVQLTRGICLGGGAREWGCPFFVKERGNAALAPRHLQPPLNHVGPYPDGVLTVFLELRLSVGLTKCDGASVDYLCDELFDLTFIHDRPRERTLVSLIFS